MYNKDENCPFKVLYTMDLTIIESIQESKTGKERQKRVTLIQKCGGKEKKTTLHCFTHSIILITHGPDVG